jgi:hypothetical protein
MVVTTGKSFDGPARKLSSVVVTAVCALAAAGSANAPNNPPIKASFKLIMLFPLSAARQL